MYEYDPLIEFAHRLWNEWLPTYCHDPKRGYAVAGYKANSNKVTPVDARDFLRALESHVVEDSGGGRYRLPKSEADAVIFWEGRKTKSPRPITLWMEPVITIASMARLHFDYGWPRSCLGMESAKWQFDFTAFLSTASATEHIAGEVKKSVKELDLLLEGLLASCREGRLHMATATAARINAHRKWEGLRRSRAPLFWAVGPGGVSHLFRVSYASQDEVCLHEVYTERLAYPACGV
jgi:hypothetical protein